MRGKDGDDRDQATSQCVHSHSATLFADVLPIKSDGSFPAIADIQDFGFLTEMLKRVVDKLKNWSRERALEEVQKGILNGQRPPSVPKNWIGTPTVSSPGFRWDDPENAGNSVRFFRGDPNDPNPSHQETFVIVVRDGRVVDKHGNVIEDEAVTAEALSHR